MTRPHRIRRLLSIPAGLLLLTLQACAPSSLGYLNIDSASIVNGMRVDGKVTSDEIRDAAGVAILDTTTVGIAVGVTGGHGVVLRRNGNKWSSPVPVDLISGSIGLQLGGKNSKVLMIFRSAESFDAFVFKGSDFVAEASGTAGGSNGGAGDPLDQKDVDVIVKSGGLYGGAVIGGIGVSVNKDLLHKAYGEGSQAETVLSGRSQIPAGAEAVWSSLDG